MKITEVTLSTLSSDFARFFQFNTTQLLLTFNKLEVCVLACFKNVFWTFTLINYDFTGLGNKIGGSCIEIKNLLI